MSVLYDTNAAKKATNLSVNSDLLDKSRALKINLSAALESTLKQKLAEAESKKWAEQNRDAIKAYNEFVEEHGCFGDEYRSF